MRIIRAVQSACLAVALLSTSACIVSARPRAGVVYAVREPPAERVEVIGRAPGPEYVYVKGHWGWRRDDYEWMPGRWAVPERGLHEWEPGRWEHERSGWYYVDGHWR